MEQFANEPSANLDGSINNSVTSITVKNRVNIPSAGTFRARVDTEYLKVTAVSGTTWTVARGDGGTTAASHADNAQINVIVTKEAIDALVSIQQAGTEISTRRVINFIGATVADNSGSGRADVTISGGGATYDTGANIPGAGTAGKLFIPSDGAIQQVDTGSAWLGHGANGLFTIPPVISSWSWVNQGSATATDVPAGGIFLLAPIASGDNNHMLVRSKTPPYVVTAGFLSTVFNVNFVRTGIAIYDSSGGKLIMFCINGNSGLKLAATKYTNTTTFSADLFSYGLGTLPHVIWLRIDDNNTTRKYQHSVDGLNWITIYSESTGTYLSPDKVAIDVNSNNTTVPSFMTLVSWKEA